MISLAPAFEGRAVRVAGTAEAPLFCAVDVCNALEIANSRAALDSLDEDEKGVALTDTPGGKQEMLYVTESGLYRLVFKSRKPAAKRFRRWVTEEVLPTIRKTGRYSTPAMGGHMIEELVTVPEWLASMGIDLVENASLAELLCQRLGKATHLLRLKDGSYREADGFQRLPRSVTDLAEGIFRRDAAAPCNRTFFETQPRLKSQP